jgi:hypothetical protein
MNLAQQMLLTKGQAGTLLTGIAMQVGNTSHFLIWFQFGASSLSQFTNIQSTNCASHEIFIIRSVTYLVYAHQIRWWADDARRLAEGCVNNFLR